MPALAMWYSGRQKNFQQPYRRSDLDGNNGFVLNGDEAFGFSGNSVSGGGDVNGDGISDLIIGAYGADPNGIQDAGSSYVVFGSTVFGNIPPQPNLRRKC